MAPGPCTCGSAFRIIADIQGRQEETLYFDHRHGGVAAVHPMVFFRVMDALPLNGWQIVQEGDQLNVRLSCAVDVSLAHRVTRALKDALVRQDVLISAIDVDWVRDVPRGTTGKAQRILAQPRQITDGSAHFPGGRQV